jgi:TBC1 domain family member 13
VQGMNEVLAPLFYVFKNDPDTRNLVRVSLITIGFHFCPYCWCDLFHLSLTGNAAAAEADTYFCFVELLSGFRDNYCKLPDSSSVGIRSTLSKLSQLLKRHDEELWRHMEVTTKVNNFSTSYQVYNLLYYMG